MGPTGCWSCCRGCFACPFPCPATVSYTHLDVYKRQGGKRTGCLLLVWLLVGLWHGAGWNFLLWGLLFGLLLAAERLGLGGWLNQVPPLGHLFVLAVLGFGAVLLTGEDLGQSLALWGGLLGQGEPGGMGTAGWYALRSYGPTPVSYTHLDVYKRQKY